MLAATNKRRHANIAVTLVAISAFLLQAGFTELSQLDYFVQTCCGDGVRTEFLSPLWWTYAANILPRQGEDILILLAFAVPIAATLVLSRSVALKTTIALLFIGLAVQTGLTFFQQRGHAADRNGCVTCLGDFVLDGSLAFMFSVSLLLLIAFRLYRRRARREIAT